MSTKPKLSILSSLYQSEEYLPSYLAQITEQSIFADCEFVLVLNIPSDQEKAIARKAKDKHPEQIQLIIVDPLESLGASWNRAWKESEADLIAVWNVDDRRTSHSLELQWQAMQANPNWQLCYGDYVRVDEYGREEGDLRRAPEYSRGHFRRAFPQGGAFWVMRRDLFREIGFFDEQLKVGPDLDYSIRIAEAGFEMGRVPEILGYFTDAEAGLSTREGGRPSDIERTAIQLRYGIFDKVRNEFQGEARQYRLDHILSMGEWIAIEKLLPDLKRKLVLSRPLWILGAVRNGMRALLKSLGILDLIYALQRRFLGKEL